MKSRHFAFLVIQAILHATLIFVLLSVMFFTYTSSQEHKITVKDSNELIDAYMSKILHDINSQTEIDWDYVKSLGEQINDKYNDDKDEANSKGSGLRKTVLITSGILLCTSVIVIFYYRKCNIDIGEIVGEIFTTFVIVAILQIVYHFIVRKYYKPNKFEITKEFIERIKFHLNS